MIRVREEGPVPEPEGDEPVRGSRKSARKVAGDAPLGPDPSSAGADPAALEFVLGDASEGGASEREREATGESSSMIDAQAESAQVHVDAGTPADDLLGESGAPFAGSSEEFELVPQPSPSAAASSDPELAPEVGQGNLLTDDELLRAVCALVFASPDPISERRLCALLEGPEIGRIQATLATIQERLAASGLPLEVRAIAGGVQILTTPELGDTVQRLFKQRKAERISAAALETLAVVAYRQPVSKAEIEAIRGVQAGPILRTLIDRGFVRVTGRADVPGHPLQYGTTREFLDRFALGSLEELPRDAELAKD